MKLIERETPMDIIWLLAATAFFAASYGLIWFFDRLGTEG